MSDWQPIESVPRDRRPLRFKMPNGEEFDGHWQPSRASAKSLAPPLQRLNKAGSKHGFSVEAIGARIMSPVLPRRSPRL